MQTICLAELQPSKAELWGATLAARHLSEVLPRVQSGPGDTTGTRFIIFSFLGINGVSPSYLKRFFAPVFGLGPDELEEAEIFPLVANLTQDVREDLSTFLNERGLTVREIELNANGVQHIRFVGDLERVARQTLDALEQFEEASAIELHAAYGEHGIAQTAWNNRLSNLHRIRLATRRKQGRTLIYQSALKSKLWAKA